MYIEKISVLSKQTELLDLSETNLSATGTGL